MTNQRVDEILAKSRNASEALAYTRRVANLADHALNNPDPAVRKRARQYWKELTGN